MKSIHIVLAGLSLAAMISAAVTADKIEISPDDHDTAIIVDSDRTLAEHFVTDIVSYSLTPNWNCPGLCRYQR